MAIPPTQKERRNRAWKRAFWVVLGVLILCVVWATFVNTYAILSASPRISRYRYALLASLTYLLVRRIADEWRDG